jgi:hypothetical protein
MTAAAGRYDGQGMESLEGVGIGTPRRNFTCTFRAADPSPGVGSGSKSAAWRRPSVHDGGVSLAVAPATAHGCAHCFKRECGTWRQVQ